MEKQVARIVASGLLIFSMFATPGFAGSTSQSVSIVQVDNSKVIGSVRSVELDSNDSHLVHVRDGSQSEADDKAVFFVDQKNAQIFKKILETGDHSFELLADWTPAVTIHRLPGRRFDDPLWLGPGHLLQDDIQVRDKVTGSVMRMAQFLKAAPKTQTRDDELKGDYHGVLGLVREALDWIHHDGIFTTQDQKMADRSSKKVATQNDAPVTDSLGIFARVGN